MIILASIVFVIVLLGICALLPEENTRCKICGTEMEERGTGKYPNLATGIATGNLALGLIEETELYCPRCEHGSKK